MENSAEWELEKELERHMEEQCESLIAIKEALVESPTNEELFQINDELESSIKAAKQSLFQLKRDRLLREADAMAQAHEIAISSASSGAKPAASDQRYALDTDEPEPGEQLEIPFSVGSNCRFRHTNGLWYDGRVLAVDDSGLARVSFLYPTTEDMQVCRFFLQQRCRFGSSCLQSHGVEFPVHALQPFLAPQWQEVAVGSTILACDAKQGARLWRAAELESVDELNGKAAVVFVSDGLRAELDYEKLALSEQAQSRDSEGSSSEEDEEEEDVHVVGDVGMDVFLMGDRRSGQGETVTFARWEKHTRGMASKMMANMGFREGMGLGKSGQGQLAPIEVKVLPSKQSLGYADTAKRADGPDGGTKVTAAGKKKARGGKRKRQKKWAAAAFAAKVEMDRQPDVFGFINQQLGGQFNGHPSAPSTDSRGARVEPIRKRDNIETKPRKEDRRAIIARDDEILELRNKILKLEDMAKRNQKEKAVVESVNRKLQEARKALAETEFARTSATMAVHTKENEKKWLRF